MSCPFARGRDRLFPREMSDDERAELVRQWHDMYCGTKAAHMQIVLVPDEDGIDSVDFDDTDVDQEW